jgi:hypothetical protein
MGGVGKKRKRRAAAERAPDLRPSACVTLALDVNLTEVQFEAWCEDCDQPTMASVVALVTPANDPSVVVLRVAQAMCHVCGRVDRG